MPSASLASKRALAFDAALSWVHGELVQEQKGPIYMYADSSVQAKTDWLLSMYDWISDTNLEPCFSAVHTLMDSSKDFQEISATTDEDGDEELELLLVTVVNKRHQAGSTLAAGIHRHRRIPVSVTGNTDLEAKARAIAHGTWVENATSAQTVSFSHRIRAMCVDRGVEMGLPAAEGGSMIDYLPRWLTSSQRIQADNEASISGQAALTARGSSRLMPHALLSAGLCHCFNNLENDMDKKVPFWKDWLPGFKAVIRMLGRRDLLERVCEKCLKPNNLQGLCYLFRTEAPKVPKWRRHTQLSQL